MSSFFNMGGFGIYVWPAYGITLAVFALNIGLALLEKRKIKKIISEYVKQNES